MTSKLTTTTTTKKQKPITTFKFTLDDFAEKKNKVEKKITITKLNENTTGFNV